MSEPLIFSLEGIDGAGKSTQCVAVGAKLGELGLTMSILKSPRDDLMGNFIRQNVRELDPWLRNRLFMLDIEVTIREEMRKEGEVIQLWDRYIDSFYASNEEMDITEAIDLTSQLPKPIKTFLLDINPEHIFSERKQALDHHSIPAWLTQKATRYHELAEVFPDRIEIIDAQLPEAEITSHIVEQITSNL